MSRCPPMRKRRSMTSEIPKRFASDKPHAEHEDGRSFAADIEHAAKGEPIGAVVIGGGDTWDEKGYDEQYFPKGVPPLNVPLGWDEARPYLDYEYDPGYGGADCAPVWVYTPTRVLFVGTYDGATWIASVPRQPDKGEPDHIGGG